MVESDSATDFNLISLLGECEDRVERSTLAPVDRRIDQIFADLRARDRKALMPFVCGGYPAPGILPRLLTGLEQVGASIVEIGFPFSDPIADGPVIASAMHEAIARGSTARSILEEVASVRGSLSMGLVAMVSVTIIHRLGGPRGFASAARQAGFDGLIVPDAPIAESGALVDAAKEHGLTLSLLIAPSTTLARAEAIVKACTGFVYLLSRSGITGANSQAPEIAARVAKLRQLTPLPIACGFGVSNPDHVREVVRHADAAIVGSAIVQRMRAAESAGADPIDAAIRFTSELMHGVGGGGGHGGGDRSNEFAAGGVNS